MYLFQVQKSGSSTGVQVNPIPQTITVCLYKEYDFEKDIKISFVYYFL